MPMQAAILEMAFDMLEHTRFPRTTVQTPFRWQDDAWRANFMRVQGLEAEELLAMGADRRERQAASHTGGQQTVTSA